jgi:hypothetical protein
MLLRLLPIVALFAAAAAFVPAATPVVSTPAPPGVGLAAAQDPMPVTVPPGAVPLIRDEADTPGLPRHFRTTTDPFRADAPAPLPSRAGLDALRSTRCAPRAARSSPRLSWAPSPSGWADRSWWSICARSHTAYSTARR